MMLYSIALWTWQILVVKHTKDRNQSQEIGMRFSVFCNRVWCLKSTGVRGGRPFEAESRLTKHKVQIQRAGEMPEIRV